MSSNFVEEKFMERAIELAELARGLTSPNPMVGAVIVKDGNVVAEGYHQYAGGKHAEIEALHKAGGEAKGAAMYVNLEPCCHQGKTPPCVPEIIKAGISRVVIAVRDPNLLVHGKGIKQLEDAGIDVEVGVLEEKAKKLNEVFFKFITTGLPFVTMKYAMTLDGKIATREGESKWITSEEARDYARRLRSFNDAVMVGIDTVLADDPQLTARFPGAKEPRRIILDSSAKLPLKSKLITTKGGKVMVVVTNAAPKSRIYSLEKAGVEVLKVRARKSRVHLASLMQVLCKDLITSILLEGGSTLNASAIEEGVVDKIMCFVGFKILGGSGALSPIGGEGFEKMKDALGIRDLEVKFIGEDLLIEGYVKKG